VWTEVGYCFVRHPDAIQKDAMQLSRMPYSEWITLVGEAGYASSSCFPVMREWYLALMRGGTKTTKTLHRNTGILFWIRGLKLPNTIHTMTRLSYWLAFGINPHEQTIMEEYYRSLTFSNGGWTGILEQHLPEARSSDEWW
jgi:amino acid permease